MSVPNPEEMSRELSAMRRYMLPAASFKEEFRRTVHPEAMDDMMERLTVMLRDAFEDGVRAERARWANEQITGSDAARVQLFEAVRRMAAPYGV